MNKFEGTPAMMVRIGRVRFALEGNKLWSLEDGKWRRPGETEWMEANHGGYHDLTIGTVEITDAELDLVYSVNIHGFEEKPKVSAEYMCHAISQKLDLLEYSNGRVYALQAKERVELGCRELAVILEESSLVNILHRANDRTLYRYIGKGSAPTELLKYPAEIKKAYDRLVPHE